MATSVPNNKLRNIQVFECIVWLLYCVSIGPLAMYVILLLAWSDYPAQARMGIAVDEFLRCVLPLSCIAAFNAWVIISASFKIEGYLRRAREIQTIFAIATNLYTASILSGIATPAV